MWAIVEYLNIWIWIVEYLHSPHTKQCNNLQQCCHLLDDVDVVHHLGVWSGQPIGLEAKQQCVGSQLANARHLHKEHTLQ